jgi:hypothetical protein
MLFSSVELAKKNGTVRTFTEDKKIDISCYKNFYLHLLFTNLATIKKDFSNEYGELVLCIDSKNTWRKDFYPLYKSGRNKKRSESDIDFTQFYTLLDETIQTLDESFPFKVVKVAKSEADDIVGVLAKNATEKSLVISEDKDFAQLLKYPKVSFYRPIKKEFVNMDKAKLTMWRATHIVGGDAGDDVPTIKFETAFSKAFIDYLRQNDIFETDVRKFNKLSISNKLYSEFTGVDKKGNIDIFKPALFGKVKIEDFCKDIRNGLKENKLYWDNYKRNRTLVMFDYIPKDIQDSILDTFSKAEVHYNPLKIKSYFEANTLRQLSENVQSFFIDGNKITVSKGMFDAWS